MKWDKTAGSKGHKGFTIVEVVTVLAITGLLFVGAARGIGSTLERQRYDDAVQQTAQLLRGEYGAGSRTRINERDAGSKKNLCELAFAGVDPAVVASGATRGRTDCSVYGTSIILGADDGKLVQSLELVGKDLVAYRKELAASHGINIKDISDAEKFIMGLNEKELIEKLQINNFFMDTSVAPPLPVFTDLRKHEKMQWETHLEWPNGKIAKAAILVIRSPRDGAIRSYVHRYLDTEEVIDYRESQNNAGHGASVPDSQNINKILKNNIYGGFISDHIDLCIASDDENRPRRTIHIEPSAHGAGAIELIDFEADPSRDVCNS